MAIPISNVTRRVVYSPSGAGGAGPYAFTFEILANTDIAVYKDDVLLTLTTHYTVSIASNGTGSVTITATGLALAPVSPTQYAIVGNRTISRSTDFTTGGDFFANTLNDELDQQTIFAQQNAEGVARALSAPQTDPTSINMTLPRSTVRAGKVLTFDSTGNPTAEQVIGSNRGNWASGTSYFLRDLVKDTTTNNIFQVITAHTSSGSLPITTNADSAKWTLLVDAATATTSATNAAASASAAATSASNASTSATSATASASTATTQASNASTSATNASNSATAASSSATTASTAATNAGNSATSASTSATNAANSATSASGSASTATTQASNASTSATSAAASASTATTQATNASTSASGASTSASNAATSASNASTSATAAAASAASAAASFDAFDDIYLGAKSSDPALDNDGNALTTGDQYFNTTANELRVYNGSTWQAASTVGGTVTSLNVTGVASFADGSAAAPSITNDGDTNTGIFFPAADTIAFSEGGAEAMRITSAGDVGIGNTSPSAKLTVSGFVVSGGQNYSGRFTDAVNSTYSIAHQSGLTNLITDTAMAFYTSTTERMRIDTSGNVGIGMAPTNFGNGYTVLQVANASNGGMLYLTNTSNAGGRIYGNTAGITYDAFSTTYHAFNTNGSERARITSDGRFYVNQTAGNGNTAQRMGVTYDGASEWAFAVKTTEATGGNAISFQNSSGTQVGFINQTNSATSYSTSSDYRLKEDIAPMTGALAKVALLKPVTYKWKSDGSDAEGFIAHELAEVCPDAVTGQKDAVDADGNPKYQGIDTSFLVATLTAAIQELTARIVALEAK